MVRKVSHIKGKVRREVIIERRDNSGKMLQGIISIAIFLLVQTGGAIWWASGMSTSFNYMQQSIIALNQKLSEASTDRYTGTEAKMRAEVVDRRIERLESEVKSNSERMLIFQSAYQDKLKKLR